MVSELKRLPGRTRCGRRVWRELQRDSRPVVVKRGDGGFGVRALFCPYLIQGLSGLTHSLGKDSPRGRLCVCRALLSLGRQRWGNSV